jgi:hypothetical protein
MQRSLLGNISVTCNNTAGVATQPFPRNNVNIVGRCFLCCPCRGYITPFASCQTELGDSIVTGSSAVDTCEYNSAVPGVDEL